MLYPSKFFTHIFLENMVFPSCDVCLNESSKRPLGWVFWSKKAYYPIYHPVAALILVHLIRLQAEIYSNIFFTEQDARMSTSCSVGSMIFEAFLDKSSKTGILHMCII